MKVGWQIKKLGDLCDVLDHKRKPITKRNRAPGEHPYYGATGVLDYVADYLFDEPLVLVGEDGAKWESGENTAFAVEGKIWVNNHAHVLRPHRTQLLDNWLIYHLNHSDLTKFVSGLTVPKLNQGNLREVPIPLPPLAEQRRIVGILDEAFEGIATAKANAEKNLQNARAIFDSHLQSVFIERSEKWTRTFLGEICTFSSGGTPSKSNSAYWNGKIPWVSGRDMKTDRIGNAALHISQLALDESATRIAPTGSLLILVRGMGLANGIPIAEVVSPCAFNQDIKAFRPRSDIDPRFLLFSLRCTLSRSDSILNRAAHGTLKIDMDDIRRIPVSIPSLATQKSIISGIDSLSIDTQRLASLYQRKLVALEALKKSLLHQAFAGELTAQPEQILREVAVA
jgi:type I restriction enzyme S subunit